MLSARVEGATTCFREIDRAQDHLDRCHRCLLISRTTMPMRRLIIRASRPAAACLCLRRHSKRQAGDIASICPKQGFDMRAMSDDRFE